MRIDKIIFPSAPGTTSTSDHPGYRRDIDGLRAIAVLSVVVFHAFPTWLRGGFIGVDIFFIISGYLISSILIKGLEQGTFSFATFYARRIKRIFPALFVVMAACCAFGWFALFPDEYKQLGKHMFGGAAFIANLFLWNEVGYFDRAAETKPLLHLWSLGIEEQFYIFWPVILLLAWKRRIKLAVLTAVLAGASFLLNVGGVTHHASATFYSPASRAWELLFGALLAGHLLKPGQANAAPRHWHSVAGLLMLAIGAAFITRERHFPGWFALLPALGAVLLIGAGPQALVNRTLLSNRVMVWFGLISYPLYLWHWPLLSFAQIIESHTPSVAVRAGAVALAVALAWITYRFIERPLRFGAGPARVVGLAIAMTGLAALGGYLFLHDGLPRRATIVENAAQNTALVTVEHKANAAACKARYGFASMYEFCLLAHADKDPTVLLIGDSHAYHVVVGLSKYYGEHGENLLMLGTRLPYWGVPVGDDPYQKATQPMLELGLATASIKTVLITTALRFDRTPGSAWVLAAMRETFRHFEAAGKRVIVIDDIPMLDFEPRACIKRAGIISSATKSPCAMRRADFDRATAEHTAALASVLKDFPRIALLHTAPRLCDAQFCWAMKDNKLLYRDIGHLSYDGDLYVGQSLAMQLDAIGLQVIGSPLR